MPMQEVIEQGTTIDQVGLILERNAAGHVAKCFCDEIGSVDRFREIICEALDQGLANSESAAATVVINYDMGVLARVTGSEAYLVGLPNPDHVDSGLGHMSVISAYHADSDRFLLLDTWPGTPSGWATAADLYAAVRSRYRCMYSPSLPLVCGLLTEMCCWLCVLFVGRSVGRCGSVGRSSPTPRTQLLRKSEAWWFFQEMRQGAAHELRIIGSNGRRRHPSAPRTNPRAIVEKELVFVIAFVTSQAWLKF
jgi:hypothetical protein